MMIEFVDVLDNEKTTNLQQFNCLDDSLGLSSARRL